MNLKIKLQSRKQKKFLSQFISHKAELDPIFKKIMDWRPSFGANPEKELTELTDLLNSFTRSSKWKVQNDTGRNYDYVIAEEKIFPIYLPVDECFMNYRSFIDALRKNHLDMMGYL